MYTNLLLIIVTQVITYKYNIVYYNIIMYVHLAVFARNADHFYPIHTKAGLLLRTTAPAGYYFFNTS